MLILGRLVVNHSPFFLGARKNGLGGIGNPRRGNGALDVINSRPWIGNRLTFGPVNIWVAQKVRGDLFSDMWFKPPAQLRE